MRAEEGKTCLDWCRITGPQGFSVSLNAPSPPPSSTPELCSADNTRKVGRKPVPRNGSLNTGPDHADPDRQKAAGKQREAVGGARHRRGANETCKNGICAACVRLLCASLLGLRVQIIDACACVSWNVRSGGGGQTAGSRTSGPHTCIHQSPGRG